MARSWGRGLCIVLVLLGAFAVMGQASRDLRRELPAEGESLDGSGRIWALVVGISRYKNVAEAAQLEFAARDAESFASFLRSPAGGELPSHQIRVLTDEHATLAALRNNLQIWLPRSAGPNDTVFIYFAGHGTVDVAQEAHLLAHDSDPQNLYATALSVPELDDVLNTRLKVRHIIFIADACHSGSLGWVSKHTVDPLPLVNASLGNSGGSSQIRLLASSDQERSYEDRKWGGGHGVFTYYLLEGLEGRAGPTPDGIVRIGALMDYVSAHVASQTESRQHPRIAGSFEARLPLAAVIAGPRKPALPTPSATPNVRKLREQIESGRLFGTGGAWELYQQVLRAKTQDPVLRAAESELAAALEGLGQEGINDYVQSLSLGLKQHLLRRSAEAYQLLQAMRPGDPKVAANQLFCEGRLRVLQGKPAEAIPFLQKAISIDPGTACPQSALGAAYQHLGRIEEAKGAYRRAIALAPEWFLPRVSLAALYMAHNQPLLAIPELRLATGFSPRSAYTEWMLAHAYFQASDWENGVKEAEFLIRKHPDYAPGYSELGLLLTGAGQEEEALEALNSYLQLAPNYADAASIQSLAARLRSSLPVAPAEIVPAPASATPPVEAPRPGSRPPSLLKQKPRASKLK